MGVECASADAVEAQRRAAARGELLPAESLDVAGGITQRPPNPTLPTPQRPPKPTPQPAVLLRRWCVRNGEVLARAEGRAAADAVCAELGALAARAWAEEGAEEGAVGAEGAPTASELREFVSSCASANATNWSSMHQDVAGGRRTEVEHLNGRRAE